MAKNDAAGTPAATKAKAPTLGTADPVIQSQKGVADEPEHPTLDAGEVLYRYYQTVHFGVDATLPNGAPAWTPATKANFHAILAKHDALLQPSEGN